MGDRLAREGYRGFLEIDVLVDLDTGAVYLGELNPRISGASSMTNVTAGPTPTCRCSCSTSSSS
jgi:biotin carboxylase